MVLKAFNLAYPQDPSPHDQQIRRQHRILPPSPAQSTSYHPSFALSLQSVLLVDWQKYEGLSNNSSVFGKPSYILVEASENLPVSRSFSVVAWYSSEFNRENTSRHFVSKSWSCNNPFTTLTSMYTNKKYQKGNLHSPGHRLVQFYSWKWEGGGSIMGRDRPPVSTPEARIWKPVPYSYFQDLLKQKRQLTNRSFRLRAHFPSKNCGTG